MANMLKVTTNWLFLPWGDHKHYQSTWALAVEPAVKATRRYVVCSPTFSSYRRWCSPALHYLLVNSWRWVMSWSVGSVRGSGRVSMEGAMIQQGKRFLFAGSTCLSYLLVRFAFFLPLAEWRQWRWNHPLRTRRCRRVQPLRPIWIRWLRLVAYVVSCHWVWVNSLASS